MRTGAEVSQYVSKRGGVERFSLCQRGRQLLEFVEVGSEILEVKERRVFQQALVAFLREQGVPTQDSETNGLAGIGQDLVSSGVAVALSEESTTAR